MVTAAGRLTLGLRENDGGGGVIRWNGSPHRLWVLVSLHSGKATVTIDGTSWHGRVTLPRPTASWWYEHVEEASVQGVPLNPHPPSVSPEWSLEVPGSCAHLGLCDQQVPVPAPYGFYPSGGAATPDGG